MNIVIDIGSSGFKAGVCTLVNHFFYYQSLDNANGGSRPFYSDGEGPYDNFIEMENKKKFNNGIYDFHDVMRVLTDSSVANDLVVRNRRPLGGSPKETGDIELTMSEGEEKHTELLSYIIGGTLKSIANNIIAKVNGVLNKVSLIVPWDYQENQFKFLRNASLEVHMGKMQLIDERIATILPYLYYGGINRQDSLLFLLDYGNSVLSYSFIRLWHGHIKIRSSNQLHSFSGSYLNQLILKYLSLKYRRIAKSNLFQDVKDLSALLIKCEHAKEDLSKESSVDINLTILGAKLDISLQRQELETLLLLPMHAIREEIKNSLKKIQWTAESIDHIIAVGSNSKIPAVTKMLASLFPFAESKYSDQIESPSTLGGSLVMTDQTNSFKEYHLCYRIRCDDGSYALVGQNLQMLTKEVMLVPISSPKKSSSTLLKLMVECCEVKNLTPSIPPPPSDLSCQPGWRFVFGYDYNMDFKQYFGFEDYMKRPLDEGKMNPDDLNSDLPALKQECVQVVCQMMEDGRMVLSMSQVSRGRLIQNSTVRFTFFEGCVTEDEIPSSEVVSEHHLMSLRFQEQKIGLTHTSSVVSSSVLPSLLSDTTRSSILVVDPEERPHTLLTEPIVISCPNRHLRTQTLPQLINKYNQFIMMDYESPTLTDANSAEKRAAETQCVPLFEAKPRTSTANQLMFFVGPDVDMSPITACCYEGEFENGYRQGSGTEYSISKEVVYKGTWKNDKYNGEGTLWMPDGCCFEGTFVDGKLNGPGKFYRADKSLGFSGLYEDGEKSGSGTEYEIDGSEYHGEFKHDKRNGRGSVKKGNDILFDGEWVDGMKEGHGKEIQSLVIYEGSFKQGKRHGEGVLSLPGGQLIYSGSWANGKKSGQGCEILKGGIKYEGSFRNDQYDGAGKQWQDNVLVFDGHFRNGFREGAGTVYNQDGSIASKGMFHENRLNGICTIYHGSPSVYYTGMVTNDLPNGQGIEHLANGDIYEGEFVNGKWHGRGQLRDSEMRLKYEGRWKCGLRHGEGKNIDDQGVYVGEYEKGLKHGEGKLEFYNQSRYVGQFMDDLFNGKGRLISSEGRVVYDGEWRNGLRCGEGKLYFENGEYFQGSFCDDMMCGKGVYFYSNGMPKYVGEMRNNRRNGEGIEYDTGGEIVEQGFYINDKCVIPIEYPCLFTNNLHNTMRS